MKRMGRSQPELLILLEDRIKKSRIKGSSENLLLRCRVSVLVSFPRSKSFPLFVSTVHSLRNSQSNCSEPPRTLRELDGWMHGWINGYGWFSGTEEEKDSMGGFPHAWE